MTAVNFVVSEFTCSSAVSGRFRSGKKGRKRRHTCVNQPTWLDEMHADGAVIGTASYQVELLWVMRSWDKTMFIAIRSFAVATGEDETRDELRFTLAPTAFGLGINLLF